MPNSNSNSIYNSWSLCNENQSATASNFEALTAAETDAMPVELGMGTAHAALTLIRESLTVLSAFAMGKEARLSRNKSAQLCELMNCG